MSTEYGEKVTYWEDDYSETSFGEPKQCIGQVTFHNTSDLVTWSVGGKTRHTFSRQEFDALFKSAKSVIG